MHRQRRPSGYEKPADWRARRTRVMRRDRGICYLCGQSGADTVDHVTPVSQGGTHDETNLKAAHRHPCHAAKTERERLAGLARRATRRKPRPNPNLINRER